MGRYVGRSRGCQTCIKRRVKCTEEMPECHQCVSSGFDCPGPVTGPIFIDMSEGVRRKSTRTGSKHSNKKPLKTTKHNPCPDSVTTPQTSDLAKCLPIDSHASRLPESWQPSRQDIFQDLYIANFISAQNATMQPWILELPNLISTSSDHQSELYGIRAVTLAYYAKVSHNTDLEFEASKWYSKGLVAQQQELRLATRMQNYSRYCHKVITAAMIFSYFECVITTVPMGWMQHYIAAIKMFEIAGPENCQTGLMHLFFRSVRVADFIISLTADEPSVLASAKWCTIPFSQNPKPPFENLVDILLQLPSCLPVRNEMRKNISSNPAKAAALRGQLGITAKQLLNRLDNFWQANKKAIDPQYNQRLQAISLSSPLPSMPWFSCAQPVPFQSASDAYFTAMYDAGKFITIGYVGAASREPTSYEPAIVMHGSSILAAAAYCERQGAFNGVSFSMVVPIKLVCLLSPSEEQRVLARNVLLRWGEERGLTDLCQVAGPSYLDRSHG